MVLFPKPGGRYWVVADFWERFHTLPVMVVGKIGGQYAVRPHPDASDTGCRKSKGAVLLAVYNLVNPATRRGLFKSQRAAQKYADRQNRKGSSYE